MHEKFEFDQVVRGVKAEKGNEKIEVQSHDEEESAKKIKLLLLVNIVKMFKKIKKIEI